MFTSARLTSSSDAECMATDECTTEAISHNHVIGITDAHTGDNIRCPICEPPGHFWARTFSNRELLAELEFRLISGALQNGVGPRTARR